MPKSAKQVTAVFVVALTVVACGSTSRRAANGSTATGPAPVNSPSPLVSASMQATSSTGAVYSGPITAARRDPAGLGYTLTAPATFDRPGVAWTSLSSLCGQSFTRCPATGRATILLARATSMNGAQIQSDGSVVKTVDNRLVYVMYWTGVPCVAFGAPVAAGAPSPSSSVCVVEDVADAGTGVLLYAGQSSEPEVS
jgi:hypothetical protein